VAELEVHIIAPERRLWTGSATSVTAPAANGYVGILPQHEPMLASLKKGHVRVRPIDSEPLEFDVEGGVLSVDSDVVTILVGPEDVVPTVS
jgi:F-type H+-transporting ATPase subunit epsilon